MKTFFKTPEAIAFDKRIDKSPYKEPLRQSMEQGSWAMTCYNKIGLGSKPSKQELEYAGVAQKQQKR